MKKVALCLSGQPRFIKQYYPFIKNCLIDPNNPDIFCHFWFSKYDLDKPIRYGEGWRNDRLEASSAEDVIKLYQPKKYAFEPQIPFRNGTIDFTKSLKSNYAGGAENKDCANYYEFATFSMWNSILKCNILKEEYAQSNNIKYDWVIKCRFDLGIGRAINLDDFDPQYIYGEDLGRSELINNWMNFGNNTNMNVLCSMFNYLDKYYQETGLWVNELFTQKICEDNNISIRKEHFGLHLTSKAL